MRHQYYLLWICLTLKTFIDDMFQMTQIPSWKIGTFLYHFHLLQFHLFDTSNHLTLIYKYNQSWAYVTTTSKCMSVTIPFFSVLSSFTSCMQAMMQLHNYHLFLKLLYIFKILNVWLIQIFVSLYE